MSNNTIPSFSDLNIEDQRRFEYNGTTYFVKKYTAEVETSIHTMIEEAANLTGLASVVYDRKLVGYATNVPPDKLDSMDVSVVHGIVEMLVGFLKGTPKKKEPSAEKSEKSVKSSPGYSPGKK